MTIKRQISTANTAITRHAEQSALLTDNRKDHIILRFRHKAKLLQAFSSPQPKILPLPIA